MMPPIENHPFQPFINAATRVLFLGSFPPQRKRWCIDWYYPNFINDHWRIQGMVFFNDPNYFVDTVNKTFFLDKIIDHCTLRGIGFYDTATAVRRLADNASDKYLEIVVPTDINALITEATSLKAIVTTGTKATETICSQLGLTSFPQIGESMPLPILRQGIPLRLFRLPSSSRAYPLSLQKKAQAYKKMFQQTGLL